MREGTFRLLAGKPKEYVKTAESGGKRAQGFCPDCGTAIYFLFAWRHARDKGFLQAVPSRHTLWQQLKLSLPASMQQVFFSAGLVTLVWIVGMIGVPILFWQLRAQVPAPVAVGIPSNARATSKPSP